MNITEYIISNFSKIKKSGERKISKNLLANFMWVQINDNSNDETMFIFKEDNSLLVSINGQITRCSYEFVVDSDTIIINDNSNEILYYVALVQDDFLILNHSFLNKVIIFANKTKHKDFVKKILNTYFEEQVKFKTKQRSKTHNYTEQQENLSIDQLYKHMSKEASYHFDRNQFEEALNYYNKLLEISPDKTKFKIQKCNCLAHLGKGSECVTEIKKLKGHSKSAFREFFNILSNLNDYSNSYELLEFSLKHYSIQSLFKDMTLREFKQIIKVYSRKNLKNKACSILFIVDECKAKQYLAEIHKEFHDSDFDIFSSFSCDNLEEYYYIKKKAQAIINVYSDKSTPSSLSQLIQTMQTFETKGSIESVKNNLSPWRKIIRNAQDKLFDDLKSKYHKCGLQCVVEMEKVLLSTNYDKEEFLKFQKKLKYKRKIKPLLTYFISAAVILTLIFLAPLIKQGNYNKKESKQVVTEDTELEDSNYDIARKDVIRNYVTASDTRNFNKMKSYFASNMTKYWELDYPSISEIEKEISRVWSLTSSSNNEIKYITTVDKANRIYHLHTAYYYTTKKGKEKRVYSTVEYQFDKYNKIKYINKASN